MLMHALPAILGLTLIVAAITMASRQPHLAGVFRWTPVPLWCYAAPALVVAAGLLPRDTTVYRALTEHLLPLALGLLMLGVDLIAVWRTGARALLAAAIGAAGILGGAVLGTWWLQAWLPPEAWKGAGALAGTWTGGTMNLLALRSVLGIPETIFAALILVDAVIAYSWMALLVALSNAQEPINRWFRPVHQPSQISKRMASSDANAARGSRHVGSALTAGLIAIGLALTCRVIATRLPPVPGLITSVTGWTIMLVTTMALLLAMSPALRRIGAHGDRLGYPALYLVLAATGAQAHLDALWSAPVWLGLGAVIVAIHGALLVVGGRLFRIPLGLLATASQANIGGLISAPIVGAVYHRSLAPVGLLLAMAGNALGTYAGMAAAMLSRWMAG